MKYYGSAKSSKGSALFVAGTSSSYIYTHTHNIDIALFAITVLFTQATHKSCSNRKCSSMKLILRLHKDGGNQPMLKVRLFRV